MQFKSALLLSLLALPLPMLADTIYTYTGYGFNESYNNDGAFTHKDYVSGTLTFAQPLGDNYSATAAPSSFSFSDGVSTITSLTALPGTYLDMVLTTNSTGIYTENSGEGDINPAVDGGEIATSPTSGEGAYIYDASGKWTETSVAPPSAVPEPSTLMLFGTGMLGLIGMIRRRPEQSC